MSHPVCGLQSSRSYVARAPKSQILYRLVERHLDELIESFYDPNNPDTHIPKFVENEFRSFLTCGIPEFGFIRLRCDRCAREHPLPFSCKGRALCPSCGARRMEDTTLHLVEHVIPDVQLRQYVLSPPFELRGLLAARGEVLSHMARVFIHEIKKQLEAWAKTKGFAKPQCGAMTFIQRFNKTLTIHPHLHVVVLDGIYHRPTDDENLVFEVAPPPSKYELMHLARNVFKRMEKYLRAHGYLDSDEPQRMTNIDQWYHRAQAEPSMLTPIKLVHDLNPGTEHGGFSVHAGVTVKAGDKRGREQLCRYVTRPPFANDQFREEDDGNIRFTLRKPAKNGQTSIVLEPLRLLRRLAWLIPPPRQHQVRFHGILGPAAKSRPDVVPIPPLKIQLVFPVENMTPPERFYRAPWAKLIRRVYDLDAQTCPFCNGPTRPVGAVTDPTDARRYLEARPYPPRARAPPGQMTFAL